MWYFLYASGYLPVATPPNLCTIKIIATIVLLLAAASFSATAQSVITFVDGDSSIPVPDVLVKYSTNTVGFRTSDSNGKVTVAGVYPIVIWASHINFAPILDTLYSPASKDYQLTKVTNQLDEVVITGQYEPQAAGNSVYKIQSISKNEIQQRGATNLAQVLTTSLNIRIQNDAATGTSSINMQGISGENIKVLIDGVPLTGRVGNQIDLGQIDLSQVEKVEIVEGPMAVSYGSNAMGGVINIITKKNLEGRWFLNGSLNEESVGNSYGLENGVHNQFLSGGFRINPDLHVRLSMAHKAFGGYRESTENRSYNWNPKYQWIGDALVGFSLGKVKTFYKLDYLNETIESPGESSGIFNPIAADDYYHTDRVMQQLQFSAPLSDRSRLNGLLAYTNYEREKEALITQINSGKQTISKAEGAQDTTSLQAFNFRTSFVHNQSNRWSYEVGWDINLEAGEGGRLAGNGKQRIDDYGLYGSTELSFGSLTFRPGLRIAYNTKYQAPLVPSLNIKSQPATKVSLRAAVARGYRAPSLKELYLEFVDSSHKIYGNEDLEPEDGLHVDLGIGYDLSSATSLQTEFFYNELKNKIDYGQAPNDPTTTTYININQFQSLGANLTWNFQVEKFRFKTGLGVTGRKTEVSEPFLYSPELIANGTYHVISKLTFGAYYKFTGQTPRFVLDEQNELTQIFADSYQWLDLNGSYRISKTFILTAGVNNVLNVISIDNGSSGGTHGGGSQFIGYGRSFFLKLDFKFLKQ